MQDGREDELVVCPEFQFKRESRAVVVWFMETHLVNSPQHAETLLDTSPMQALRLHWI